MSSRGRAALAVAGMFAALATLAAPAGAQVILDQDAEQAEMRGETSHSPQHFGFEIRFGSFRPDVDSEFTAGQHPFRDYFGKSDRLLTQGELDGQFLRRPFGSLAVGLSFGYFTASGKAPLADGSGQASGDSTGLALYPLSLALVYRFDALALRRGIPLVPFAKVGFDYTLWSITEGNGKTAKDGLGQGQGGTAGWHVAAGLSLLLDAFEPGSARELDSEVGVNHTYLFFEVAHYQIRGLGPSAGQFRVGDPLAWAGGLLLEF